jgi:hypothetical protein
VLVPLIWGGIEVGLSIYDAYDTGRTLLDPCATTRQKVVAASLFTVGVFAPGGGYSKADDVVAYTVGRFDHLLERSVKGDKLDLHHVPQKHPAAQVIPGYNPNTAPAIALPEAEHQMIKNLRGDYSGTARDLLARDARNLRNHTNAPNSAIQELIGQSKQAYPASFAKPR